MKRSLPGLLVGLVTGAVLGAVVTWTVVDGGSSLAAAVEVARPAGPQREPVANAVDLEDPGAQPASSSAERTLEVPEVSRAEAQRLLARAERPRVEASSGGAKIRGQVVSDAGTPLEGVTVVATGEAPRGPRPATDPVSVGAGAPGLDPLVEQVRGLAERDALRRRLRRQALSDAGGHFLLEGLPEGHDWRLRGYKTDWQVGVADVRPADSARPVELIAQPVVTVQVRVLLPGGSQPGSAVLQCDTQGRSSARQAWSPDRPILRLLPGGYEVRASAGELIPGGRYGQEEFELGSDPQRLVVDPASAETLTLELRGRRGVVGRLIEPDDDVEQARSTVHLARIDAPRGFDPAAPPGGLSAESWETREGFRFLDLEPGTYALYATRERGLAAVAHELVEIGEGVVQRDLTLPPFDPAGMLRVSVFAPGGSKLHERLSFRWRRVSPDSSRSSSLRTFGIQAGSHLLRPPPEEEALYFGGDPGVEFWLQIEHETHGAREVSLSPGQTAIRYDYGPAVSLEVRVTGLGNLSAGQYALVSASRTGTGSRSGTQRVGVDGTCELTALEAGTHEVRLMLQSDRSRSRGSGGAQGTVVQTTVEVRPGASVGLAMPPLHELRVRVPAELGSGRVSARDLDLADLFADATTDADGLARFSGLPGGRYELRISGRRMQVDVPCGEVLFEHREPTAFRVRISDPNGLLASGGLRSGDLIIGVDGREFTSQADTRTLSLVATRKVNALVLRGSQRIELELGPWDVQGELAVGGELDPVAR